MKVARAIPLHKEGSKSDVSNYRPISLLNSFSKIYEKLMHTRILEFLESKIQFKKISTDLYPKDVANMQY